MPVSCGVHLSASSGLIMSASTELELRAPRDMLSKGLSHGFFADVTIMKNYGGYNVVTDISINISLC